MPNNAEANLMLPIFFSNQVQITPAVKRKLASHGWRLYTRPAVINLARDKYNNRISLISKGKENLHSLESLWRLHGASQVTSTDRTQNVGPHGTSTSVRRTEHTLSVHG